jgi:hypothetical protein
MGQRFADQFSLLHVAVGVLAYFWGIGFIHSMLLHTVFEITENTPYGIRFINETLHGLWPGGKPRADTLTNIMGDSVFFGLGWWVAMSLDAFGTRQRWYEPHFQRPY